MILVSLALQVFLFVTAGMRRRSTSGVLRRVLWLAYLSADSVAIFALGHLAVHASGPRHQLLLFWAPFVLVHLGGQDTITALSVQDNELWTRHLLGLVSQVAVAGYVVSKSSWPDGRLLAAMVLMFLSGSFKYAWRTYCLALASPANLRVESMNNMSRKLAMLWQSAGRAEWRSEACKQLRRRFGLMLNGDRGQGSFLDDTRAIEIMTVDAPVNQVECVLGAGDLPGMLEVEQFLESSAGRRGPYEYVGGLLENCYQVLYTKSLVLRVCYIAIRTCPYGHPSSGFYLIATLFQYLSTPIALVLFTVAEKGDQLHSRADVIVSYILLVGAIILDVSSASMSIFTLLRTHFFPDGRIKSAILRVADYIQAAGSRKQWSEKLAQYSMIKRYTMQDTAGMSSVRQRIGKRLNACGVELLDPSLTHTPITEDLKEFVLRNLLLFGTSKQYEFASFRGQLALQKWTNNRPGTALHNSIYDAAFPTSVLIWHIATDICYYSGDNAASTDSHKMKEMSRELSNYIMYLVFKCGVMLTSTSRLVHHNVQDEMMYCFEYKQIQHLGEKEAVMKVFEGKGFEQLANTEDATSSHLQELGQSTAEAIYSPVLPRAREVAQELIGMDEARRWDLIAEVWLGMLYYTAPRCGGAFHYQHLSTGGEFITHVLLLMSFLGPFLPPPGA